MNRKVQIGFTQRLKLTWLDRTAGLLLAGSPRAQIQATLTDLLKDQLSINGTAERGCRQKAVTILLKTWVTVPRHLQSFRDEGLDHLRRLPGKDHLPAHWGMVMAVYPFFSIVAETVGRLLKLQASVAAVQIQRRVRELLGERETVFRATRRILRTLIDWGVLTDAAQKGVYEAQARHRVKDPRLGAWLIEATLRASAASSVPLDVIVQSPALFPFELPHLAPCDFDSVNRLEAFRQGGAIETLAFRRNDNCP
jgi:hypothetical protein